MKEKKEIQLKFIELYILGPTLGFFHKICETVNIISQ